MPWKIYHIESGEILRAGFAEEDEAKEWLESRRTINVEDFLVEEMDEDEEEELLTDDDEPFGLDEDEEETSDSEDFDDEDVDVIVRSGLANGMEGDDEDDEDFE